MTRSRQLAVLVGAFFVLVTALYWVVVGDSLPAAVAAGAALVLLPASSG
jgi:hypothetical protein